eukprot:m.325161 g.325161  ORF g.325161 m.325161 type:complete len:56 (+) comp19733_c2_seq11:18-185(+)
MQKWLEWKNATVYPVPSSVLPGCVLLLLISFVLLVLWFAVRQPHLKELTTPFRRR